MSFSFAALISTVFSVAKLPIAVSVGVADALLVVIVALTGVLATVFSSAAKRMYAVTSSPAFASYLLVSP